MKNILYLLPFLFLFSCKSQPQNFPPLQLSQEHKVLFLDTKAAGEAITKDEAENFFALVNKVDMSIQMKKNFSETITREAAVEEYKAFLKTDVLDFTKEEMEFVNKVFKEAYDLSKTNFPNTFPKEIKLIKTHGKHYGDGAYYTRENCIIIPKNVLELPNHNSFLEVMFHEISHIYTRYHPEERKALYHLIGFSNIGNQSNLLIKDALKNKILLNPDGVNFAYMISLKNTDGTTSTAIPIITANESEYTKTKSDFFNYLDFNLYNVKIQHSVRVISTENGNSTINMNNIPNFYEQITDNTDYIIHPDEIIADNFMYVMMREKENGLQKQFSPEGLELLKEVKEILKR